MRGTSDYEALTCSFVQDLPDGGCLVETPDGEMSTKDMNGYEPFFLKDGREIFYPSWCIW